MSASSLSGFGLSSVSTHRVSVIYGLALGRGENTKTPKISLLRLVAPEVRQPARDVRGGVRGDLAGVDFGVVLG